MNLVTQVKKDDFIIGGAQTVEDHLLSKSVIYRPLSNPMFLDCYSLNDGFLLLGLLKTSRP